MASLSIGRKDYAAVKEFERIGIQYERICDNEGYVLWGMVQNDQVTGFEVWKKRWVKNPDGTMVMKAPCDEDFGVYGWYMAGNTDYSWQRIKEVGGFTVRYTRKWGKWWKSEDL